MSHAKSFDAKGQNRIAGGASLYDLDMRDWPATTRINAEGYDGPPALTVIVGDPGYARFPPAALTECISVLEKDRTAVVLRARDMDTTLIARSMVLTWLGGGHV